MCVGCTGVGVKMGLRCGVKGGVWGCRVWEGEEVSSAGSPDQWEDDP